MNEKIEQLIKEQEIMIYELNGGLLQIEECDNKLNEERIKILEDVDDKGKKKFSNDLTREEELRKRLPDMYDKRINFRIDCDIKTMYINLNLQKINFYIKTLPE
jgi:hypothetical protein